jgi:hypothetical protein
MLPHRITEIMDTQNVIIGFYVFLLCYDLHLLYISLFMCNMFNVNFVSR